ncbi:MAG TPA: hypothetical protein VMT54_21190 [Candidatus Cybelea sp.]|nr:hypothetical protein [Candidatus Cybelea sp.]
MPDLNVSVRDSVATLNKIATVMLWPDDARLRERAELSLRLRHIEDFVSGDRITLDRDAFIAVIGQTWEAMRWSEFEEAHRRILPEGILAGIVLLATIGGQGGTLIDAKRRALEGFKAGLGRIAGRSFDIDMLDKIWIDMKPVAHLWAAAVELFDHASPKIPCNPGALPLFIERATALLTLGTATKTKRASVTILDARTSWRLVEAD